MNLPDSALTFLGNFNGVYNNIDPEIYKEMPYVHVHCFEKYENGEEVSMEELHKRVFNRILKEMDCSADILPFEAVAFHLVRKVSPTKPMFCCSFKLPKEVAFKQ